MCDRFKCGLVCVGDGAETPDGPGRDLLAQKRTACMCGAVGDLSGAVCTDSALASYLTAQMLNGRARSFLAITGL